MVVKIFVGNLQVESCPESEAQLRHMFEQFGTVNECDILTGKSFGFVHMESEEEADSAIEALNGELLFENPINVEKSANQSRGKRPPGSGFRGDRGGGFRGAGGGGFRGDRGGGRGFGGGRGRGDRGGYGGRGGFVDRGGRGRGRGADRGNRFSPYGRGGGAGGGADPLGLYGDLYDRPYPAYGGRGGAGRDPYGEDPYLALERRARLRQLYERDLLTRQLASEEGAYDRPPPAYYGRGAGARDGYSRGSRGAGAGAAAGGAADRGLVSYPIPRVTSSYGKSAGATNGVKNTAPQVTSLYTDFA